MIVDIGLEAIAYCRSMTKGRKRQTGSYGVIYIFGIPRMRRTFLSGFRFDISINKKVSMVDLTKKGH